MAVNDVVVVVPGILGSTLHDHDGQEVWGLGAGTVVHAIRRFGRSVRDLELPAGHGDEPPPDGVTPGKIMPAYHALPRIWTPVQGYSRLHEFLRSRSRLQTVDPAPEAPAGNLLSFAYDWRLSNRYNAMLLRDAAERALERWRASAPERAEAQLVFICHSMGGLIARWYAQCLGGAAHTRLIITLGTPHRGALNAAEQLVNGSRKGVGPIRLDLSDLVRSFPSVYQLLPAYPCIDDGSGTLRTASEVSLPHAQTTLVEDACAFHARLSEPSPDIDDRTVPFVGIGQPTLATGSIVGDQLEASELYEGDDLGGDGTVPRFAARPRAVPGDSPLIRGLTEGHSHLQVNGGILDQIDALLRADDRGPRAAQAASVSVRCTEWIDRGDPLTVEATLTEDPGQLLQAKLLDEWDHPVGLQLLPQGRASFDGLDEGLYTVVISAPNDPGGVRIPPVHRSALVLDGTI